MAVIVASRNGSSVAKGAEMASEGESPGSDHRGVKVKMLSVLIGCKIN